MGEWKRIVPHGELSGQVIFAVLTGGFGALVLAIVLPAPGGVVSWPGILAAITFCWGVAFLMWRSARAGVHFGRRGVLVYHVARRSEVVPWNEVVRFEALPPQRAADRGGVGVYLVRSSAEPVATPLKQSQGLSQDRLSFPFTVVLSEEEMAGAVPRLNAQADRYRSSANG